jgi:tetratricopeptide (TPR) repeat protein
VKQRSDLLQGLPDFVQAAQESEEGGDAGQAIALLRETTCRFPDDPRGHVALADTLLRCSRVVASVLEKGDFFSEAKAAAARALELDSHCAHAHLFQGQFQIMMSYRNGDDPAEGVALIRKALEEGLDARGQAQAHFFLGMAERTLGREPEAKALFRQALQLDPTFAQAALAMKGA